MARKEVHTGDMAIGQKDDLDISIGQQILHGEEVPNIAHEAELMKSHQQALAFMEDPVTIRIESNARTENPETHAQVKVNGKGAEVLSNGKWIEIEWLPIGIELTTKRKYVEVLARAKPDSIRTVHDDATVERPINTVRRTTSAQYPLAVLEDRNPRGREWLSRIMMGH